jgi:hypothetical protein
MSVFRANNTPDTDWSVPVQRGPYPMDAPYADTDSPTERLVQPSDEPEPLADPDEPYLDVPERHRHQAIVVAIVIASLALAASGTAGVFAWKAMGRTGPTAMMHMPAAGAPAMITPAPPAASAGASASAGTSSTSTPSAQAGAGGPALLYAQEPLQIQVGCGQSVKVDLDQPPSLGATDQKADLRYDNRCGSAGILFFGDTGARGVSHVTDPDLDRPGCADAIRTHPLDADEGVPVVKGTVLCLATAETLALVEVTGVTADGAAGLRATGWRIAADDTAVPSIGASPGD